MKKWILIFWPAFIVAGIAEMVFFTLFDPMELMLFGMALDCSRITIYSIGFFCFWLLMSFSSALTYFLQRSAAEVNSTLPVPQSCSKVPDQSHPLPK